MTDKKMTTLAQLAKLTELVQQNQAELKRIAALQEQILASVAPQRPPLKFVILTPPMSYEYPDIYLKVEPREWQAITEGRQVCVIGKGYCSDGELEAQDYWFFKGGTKRGRLQVLMREFFNEGEPDYWNPNSWEEAYDGPMSEVSIEEFDENEAIGVDS